MKLQRKWFVHLRVERKHFVTWPGNPQTVKTHCFRCAAILFTSVCHVPSSVTVQCLLSVTRITNLKYWSHDAIISGTLHLLGDLAVGFSSVRKLVKLEAVQFLLENDPVGGARATSRLSWSSPSLFQVDKLTRTKRVRGSKLFSITTVEYCTTAVASKPVLSLIYAILLLWPKRTRTHQNGLAYSTESAHSDLGGGYPASGSQHVNCLRKGFVARNTFYERRRIVDLMRAHRPGVVKLQHGGHIWPVWPLMVRIRIFVAKLERSITWKRNSKISRYLDNKSREVFLPLVVFSPYCIWERQKQSFKIKFNDFLRHTNDIPHFLRPLIVNDSEYVQCTLR